MKSFPTRRRFLGGAAGFAAFSAVARGASPAARTVSANDRINVGLIGVGNKGRGHQRLLASRIESHDDIRIVAISDIYRTRLVEAGERSAVEAGSLHHDYRDLLARPDIDAVWIATPDHWHARMALNALAAGKDVYLEKPMTYTIAEAQELAAAVERTGRVLQVGSQHVSDRRYARAKQAIEEGLIGQVVWAQNTYSRNSLHGEWNYTIDPEGTPENIDWQAFLGSAPERPFSAERFFRWRKYWDYSGGIATDLFYHRLAPLLLMTGVDFPIRVSGHGGIYVHKDREVPDTYSTSIEYRDRSIVLAASMASSAANRNLPTAVYGHEGSITFGRGYIEIRPEPQFRTKFRETTGQEEALVIPVEQENVSLDHIDNFLTSMRDRSKPALDAEFGYRVMTAIALGVDSYRQGRMLAWDAARERIADAPEGRPGYEGDGVNREEPPR